MKIDSLIFLFTASLVLAESHVYHISEIQVDNQELQWQNQSINDSMTTNLVRRGSKTNKKKQENETGTSGKSSPDNRGKGASQTTKLSSAMSQLSIQKGSQVSISSPTSGGQFSPPGSTPSTSNLPRTGSSLSQASASNAPVGTNRAKGRFSPARRLGEPINQGFLRSATLSLNSVSRSSVTPDQLHRARQDVAIAKNKAGYRASQVSSRRSSIRGSHSVVKDEMFAKAVAKHNRNTSDRTIKDAYQTFATKDPGSREANEALANVIKNDRKSSEAERKHIETLKRLTTSFHVSKDGASTAKHLQALHRASTRHLQRQAKTDAVAFGYLSSASKNLLGSIDPNDKEGRITAANRAVETRKTYQEKVKNYRQKYHDWQHMRSDFSGSSSDESEHSFPDVEMDSRFRAYKPARESSS